VSGGGGGWWWGVVEWGKGGRGVRCVERAGLRREGRETVGRLLACRNESACVRTAEALGVQVVYLVEMPSLARKTGSNRGFSRTISRAAHRYLSVQTFESTPAAIEAIRRDGRQIWATNLSPEATVLASQSEAAYLLSCVEHSEATRRPTGEGGLGGAPSALTSVPAEYVASLRDIAAHGLALPDKLAVVMGREMDGVSEQMLLAADRQIYLPMFGFTESFNLSVATALVLQRLFDLCPEARGDLVRRRDPAAVGALRTSWLEKLARSDDAERVFRHWAQAADRGVVIPTLPDMRRVEDVDPASYNRGIARMVDVDDRMGRAGGAAASTASSASTSASSAASAAASDVPTSSAGIKRSRDEAGIVSADKQ
jgi:SpoU rRNA Methylase family